MKRLLTAVALTAALGTLGSDGADAACGDVTVAEMNWASAEVIANLDKMILETGFGCSVELVPGDTVPTGTSMIEKGKPDVMPELWANSFVDAVAKGVEEKRLRIAVNALADGGEEGFWVPKYMVDKNPDLATLEGVIANKHLFPHPEEDGKAALIGCPAGWSCQFSTNHLFIALDLESKGFELVDPGSSAGLDGSITRAYERGQGWFGYYWAPTAILGKYEMVKVDLGAEVDLEYFQNCIQTPECADPKPSSFPPSEVKTLTTESFATREPAAYAYMTKRSLTNSVLNKVLAWKEDEQADGETTAIYFLQNFEDLWSSWLNPDQAAKVKAAVAGM